MMEEFAPLPSSILNDPHLKDGEKVTALRLLEIAWLHRRESGVMRTPTMQLDQLADLLDMSRATLYRHTSTITAREYFERNETPSGVFFSVRISRMRFRDASSSLSTGEVQDEKESSGSEGKKKRLKFETPRHRLLRDAGVGEPMRTRLAEDEELTTEQIEKHLAAIESSGEPLRFAIHRMRSHEPAPDVCDDCGAIGGEHKLDCAADRRKYREQLEAVVPGADELEDDEIDKLRKMREDVAEYARKRERAEKTSQLPLPKDIGDPPDYWVD